MEDKKCNCNDECDCTNDCDCTPEKKCSDNCNCVNDKKHHKKHHHGDHCHKNKHDDDECECNDKCDCGDDCNCDHDHKCSDDCDCDHDHCDCDDDCDCDDCDCDHEHCDCDNDCDCDHDHKCGDDCKCGEGEHKKGKHNKEDAFKMYEKAFRQLEDALIKADKEIGKEKARADENEHIARVYKQDLERFKERHKNAQNEYTLKANEDTALKLLPVLDNFNQAMEAIDDEKIEKGFEMIFSNLKEIISNLGVEEIVSLDQNFDPELHECISKIKAPSKEKSGKVARVFKAGYKLKGENGKVVRHSIVEIYE